MSDTAIKLESLRFWAREYYFTSDWYGADMQARIRALAARIIAGDY